MDHLVRKCLAKEPDDRWQSAHDLAIELKWIAEGGSQSTLSEKVMPRSGTRERLAWAIAVALFLITLALLYNFTGFMQKQKPAYLQQFSVLLPQDATPDPWGSLAISPALYPFWSPDGRFIGFFANGKLKKSPAAGGTVQALCDTWEGRGGSWNKDGLILLGQGGSDSLYSVSSAGGEISRVTTLDPSHQENTHRWPSFLPDGRHFL